MNYQQARAEAIRLFGKHAKAKRNGKSFEIWSNGKWMASGDSWAVPVLMARKAKGTPR